MRHFCDLENTFRYHSYYGPNSFPINRGMGKEINLDSTEARRSKINTIPEFFFIR
jgi:hypothetical protein